MDVSGRTRAAAVAAAAAVVGAMLVTVAFDIRLRDAGRGDLAQLDGPAIPLVIAWLVTAAVGLALTVRVRHPVGPLFLALGLAISFSAVADGYDRLSLLVDPPVLRGSRWLLYLDEASFIPWLLLIAAVLLVTPSGRLPSPRWRAAMGFTGACAVALLATRSVLPGTFSEPYNGIRHPVEVHLAGLSAIRLAVGLVVSAAPLVAAASLVRRFRAAVGEERQQLRWVAYGAGATFIGLGCTAIAAYANSDVALGVLAGASLTVLPLAIGVAVSRYRLYDLDRLLSAATTYAIVTVLLVGCWAVGVLTISTLVSVGADSALPASVATLATAGAAVPLLRRVRDAVDRRFRRRRHDALATIRAYVARPASEAADAGVEQVLQRALRDPALRALFWLGERGCYVDSLGQPVGPPAPALLLDRDGQPVAAVTSTVEPGLLAEACAAALPELEAAQLRAALQTRITELSESRARLSAATQHERRRLERDLHDGAQQRLLAVLFVLESVQRRSGEEARTLVTEALDQTRVALAELRDLAHGLRPTGLHHGGLLEAVEGLIARSPGEVALRITGSLPALAEDVETTAYYVVSEALSNVAKHAEARHTEVCVHAAAATLRVAVRDDGRGGADPAGTGLRGLADRTESAGGTLLVIDLPSGGTEIRAELPCGS